ELQRQEVAVFRLHHVVDATDVRMIELRQSARLADQALTRVGIPPRFSADRLHRDAALKLVVIAGVDLPHPSFAQEAVNADTADAPADHGRQSRLGLKGGKGIPPPPWF